ncbi:RNA BINDING PROTEIN [Salix koriyanagi]|uniref:RNA BINDING PROTEIN n=1 Tax=Salix koriyanagi TaxID=2511006 RepID=A0A9Q0ZLP5_9ROSI|nr:RNA BINDING PROTEIN [Salix koriyanagi]
MKVIANVLYIPELDQNILSVAQMLKNGYEVSFKGNFCFITDSHDSAVAKIKMEDNSFYLNMDVVKGHVLSAKSDESVLWQKRDGHANLNTLKVMHNGGMINDGDQLCKRLQICDKDGKIRDGDMFSMESNNVHEQILAESTTHEGLKDDFTEHGANTSAVMVRAAEEQSKCFEIMNPGKAEDAAEIVKTFNGKEIDGEECYVREWYMKTGGATCEGNPDDDLGQNRADISPVHHDLKTKIIPTRFMEEKKRHSKEPGIIEGQYGNDMILSHHQIIANYAPGNLLTGFRFYNPYWPLHIVDVAIVVHLVGAYQGYWAMDEAVTRVSDFFSTSCLVITVAAAVGCVAGVVLELKIKTYKPFKTSY